MNKLLTLGFSVVLSGVLAGCVVHEAQPAYAYSSQAGYNYPLYVADGTYWAYQNDAWYWWSNDHWLMSRHAPRNAILYSGGHASVYGGYGHGMTYRPSHARSHGQSSHGRSSYGRSSHGHSSRGSRGRH